MSQHDYSIDDQNGLSFLSDLNSNLAAIVSNNSGATEPATTYPYMPWADTTSGFLKFRDAGDTAWVTTLSLSEDVSDYIGKTFTSKASAVSYIDTYGINAGQQFFITSSDGGTFVGVTGAAPGTYADNGGSYCGTQFIPTGGDGSAALVAANWDHTPMAFGAALDGTTDDTAAVILALAHLNTLGGGELIIDGDCLCNTISSGGGLDWIIGVLYDNIGIVVKEGAKLRTTAAASLFHLQGAGKPNGMANWASYQYSTATSYGMSASSKGDISITLTTAAEAANFAVGDIAYIFSGQTIPVGLGNEADSEINEVVDSNATTGVVTFRWPLSKDYTQENYVAGSSGVSAVGGAGTAAPFGIANVTDRTIKNFSISGEGLLNGAAGYNIMIGGQLLGLNLIGLDMVAYRSAQSMGNYRGGIIRGNKIHLKNPGTSDYFITGATGTTDVLAEGNTFSAEGFGYLHIHEGTAQFRSVNNVYTNPPSSGSAFSVFDIRARCYDFKSAGDLIVGAGPGNAVYVDSTCTGGGEIDNLTMYAPATAIALRVETASGWKIGTVNTDLISWVTDGNDYANGRVFLSASELSITAGTPALSTVGGTRWPAWLLDAASTERVGANYHFPHDWKAAYVKIHFVNAGVGAGDVRWEVAICKNTVGENLNVDNAQTLSLISTAQAQDLLSADVLATQMVVTAGYDMSIRLSRLGGDAADTLANDVGVIGIEFIKAG